MASQAAVITGASGFIGRHLLARLAADRPDVRLTTIGRRPSPEAHSARQIHADLRDPTTYAGALDGADIVVHLAAATGAASPREHFAVNRDATAALITACQMRGVRRFVLVSSIAAAYASVADYPYAQSKRAGEEIVRGSGLSYLIVRPTIVLGVASPIWRRLSALAALPVLPVFGSGSARVQPVGVEDVARLLAATIALDDLPARTIDFGGADVLAFEELLRRIARLVKGREPRVVHVPIRPIMRVLAFIEQRLTTKLPVSAGQFTAFVEDSVARPDPLVTALVPHRVAIDELLRSLTARG